MEVAQDNNRIQGGVVVVNDMRRDKVKWGRQDEGDKIISRYTGK